MGVRILLGTPIFARIRKSAKRVGSNPTVWRFDFSREHQFSAIGRSSPTGRGSGPKPRSVQDRSLPAAPIRSPSGLRMGIERRRLAQRKSVGPTNRRSRYRNSQRLPNIAPSTWRRPRPGSYKTQQTDNPSCSSKAEQPADNRQTADRYRAGGPNKETNMNDPLKRGVFMDPERLADWIGSRLLISPQEDRNLRGSRTPSLMGRAAGS